MATDPITGGVGTVTQPNPLRAGKNPTNSAGTGAIPAGSSGTATTTGTSGTPTVAAGATDNRGSVTQSAVKTPEVTNPQARPPLSDKPMGAEWANFYKTQYPDQKEFAKFALTYLSDFSRVKNTKYKEGELVNLEGKDPTKDKKEIVEKLLTPANSNEKLTIHYKPSEEGKSQFEIKNGEEVKFIIPTKPRADWTEKDEQGRNVQLDNALKIVFKKEEAPKSPVLVPVVTSPVVETPPKVISQEISTTETKKTEPKPVVLSQEVPAETGKSVAKPASTETEKPVVKVEVSEVQLLADNSAEPQRIPARLGNQTGTFFADRNQPASRYAPLLDTSPPLFHEIQLPNLAPRVIYVASEPIPPQPMIILVQTPAPIHEENLFSSRMIGGAEEVSPRKTITLSSAARREPSFWEKFPIASLFPLGAISNLANLVASRLSSPEEPQVATQNILLEVKSA